MTNRDDAEENPEESGGGSVEEERQLFMLRGCPVYLRNC